MKPIVYSLFLIVCGTSVNAQNSVGINTTNPQANLDIRGSERVGGNINYISGHAIFEATHGTAPKYANQDKVNPGSVVLSGEMMFRYIGWTEVADLIVKGLNGAIGSKRVTYDFARLMEGATEIKCSEFGDNIIAHM